MPRVIDEDDDSPVTGGSEADEMRALAAGNEESATASSKLDENFPASAVYMISGKPAIGAASRIAWFRLIRPHWRIITEEVEVDQKVARFRATIFDQNGNIVSTGTKSWSRNKNTMSAANYIECAETSAIARALEFAGFSAQRALSGIPFAEP